MAKDDKVQYIHISKDKGNWTNKHYCGGFGLKRLKILPRLPLVLRQEKNK